MADKGKSVPRYNINKSWCGQCTARFTYYGCCLRKNGIPGSHFEPFKNWAHVSECHNECAPWLRKVDKSEKPEVDWVTFPCPWCEKPKEEYPMKGEEGYYKLGETPPEMVDDDAAGEFEGGQMHPGGYQGGNTGTMHGEVTGERMVGPRGGSQKVFFEPREDSAIISQYRQGTYYHSMNKDVDIKSNRKGATLQRRFEKFLVPKMTPSEVKSLKEERQRNIKIRMDQASSSSKTKRAEPAKKDGQRAERVPFDPREDSAIISQFRQGTLYDDMNKDNDINSNRSRQSLRQRFEDVLVPKMTPSEEKSLREERERNIVIRKQGGLILHPQHSLGQQGPSIHSERSHEDQGGNQASSLGSSSGHQHGQAQHQPPPGLTEEQRQAYDMIIRNMSLFPKCRNCFINQRTCDKAEPNCTTCKKMNRNCKPVTAKDIIVKQQLESAMKLCIYYGWILRELTEDELRFMNRAMAHQSLLGCDYCIRNELTGCEVLSSQPCKRCGARTRCRFVSGNTILEKRKFIEGRLRGHKAPARLESQNQTSHPQQHFVGQAGPSMHSGRSHEGSVSQGMVPIHQEQHTNPFSESHGHASMIQQPASQSVAPPNPSQQGRLAPPNQPLRDTLSSLSITEKRTRESSTSSSGQDPSHPPTDEHGKGNQGKDKGKDKQQQKKKKK